jgi:hypothetical protein
MRQAVVEKVEDASRSVRVCEIRGAEPKLMTAFNFRVAVRSCFHSSRLHSSLTFYRNNHTVSTIHYYGHFTITTTSGNTVVKKQIHCSLGTYELLFTFPVGPSKKK